MTISDAGFKKPETNTWKPGKPGDAIKGIYTGVVKDFEGNYGATHIYELVGIEGDYHDMDEDGKAKGGAIEIKQGEFYALFERATFKDDIQRAKRGQEILIRFVESRKPKKGGKPYKMVECLLGPMNDAWLAANSEFRKPDADEIPFD